MYVIYCKMCLFVLSCPSFCLHMTNPEQQKKILWDLIFRICNKFITCYHFNILLPSGVKVAVLRADNFTAYMCRLSRNTGESQTPGIPKGLSRIAYGMSFDLGLSFLCSFVKNFRPDFLDFFSFSLFYTSTYLITLIWCHY